MSTTVVVTKNNTDEGEETSYTQLLENTPVAEMEGEPLSPDGAYEVMTVGAGENYVSGVRPPEYVQIVDRKSGEVLWSMEGAINLSALWSEDGQYVAISYGGRTWNALCVVETENWTEWDYTFPEYTFFREDWGIWVDENSLDITADGTEGEVHYRYTVVWSDKGLDGGMFCWTTDVLDGEYDFDHNGTSDTTELVRVREPGLDYDVWYELRVEDWRQEAAEAHVGWISVFACKIDEEDYLLRYSPWMGQGYATYYYEIFSLDETGEEVVLRENGVEFDINFGSPIWSGIFDASAIAAFLDEVHEYLDESTLLISTEGGTFRTGGSGAEFREDMYFWDEYCPYDDSKTLEENLRAYETFIRAAQGAA